MPLNHDERPHCSAIDSARAGPLAVSIRAPASVRLYAGMAVLGALLTLILTIVALSGPASDLERWSIGWVSPFGHFGAFVALVVALTQRD
jgi:hypothetical protein